MRLRLLEFIRTRDDMATGNLIAMIRNWENFDTVIGLGSKSNTTDGAQRTNEYLLTSRKFELTYHTNIAGLNTGEIRVHTSRLGE